ncbi:MAG TPA: hypothetical protein VLJ19_06260 [Variovorax sp.]|nr:hypothetical protein [Variovorax sp.]
MTAVWRSPDIEAIYASGRLAEYGISRPSRLFPPFALELVPELNQSRLTTSTLRHDRAHQM